MGTHVKPEILKFIDEVKFNHPNEIRYLEIGFGNGKHFESIPIYQKVVISPDCHATEPAKAYPGRSDDIFASLKEEPFDIIFIDGLHKYEQVLRDIDNALKFLRPNGVILCHDTNPLDLADSASTENYHSGVWLGDVWKIVLHIKYLRPDLDYANIENFPGYLVLWPLKIQREISEFGKYSTNPKIKYAYNDKDIAFAREYRDEFELNHLDEAVKKFRKRLKDENEQLKKSKSSSKPTSIPISKPTSKIPIWVYWENVPGMIKPQYLSLCLRTIQLNCGNNKRFELKQISKSDLVNLLPDLRTDIEKVVDLDIKINYIKLKLLQKYGGIWINFDSIVMRKIDELEFLFNYYNFISYFSNAGEPSLNFAYSSTHNPIIGEWVKLYDKHFDGILEYSKINLLVMIRKNANVCYNLGSPIISEFHHDLLFSETQEVEDILQFNPLIIPTYMKLSSLNLSGVTTNDLLSKSWLITRLFKIALNN